MKPHNKLYDKWDPEVQAGEPDREWLPGMSGEELDRLERYREPPEPKFIERLPLPRRWRHKVAPGKAFGDIPKELSVQRMSEVVAKPIQWLWPKRIPKGKFTILAGHSHLGKSQITVSMAAITTTGGRWPVDRTQAKVGNVILLSAEDAVDDTIKPRLEAAGADTERIYTLDAIREKGSERPVNLSQDIERLGKLIEHIGDVALVIIDPISAYLGGTDTHKNADVRSALMPLGKLAADHSAAVVCVSHFNKGASETALQRVTGSLGFTAAARGTYICSKDPDDDRNLFLPAGTNLGPETYGLAYHIESATVRGIETSRVVWHSDPVDENADDISNPPDDMANRQTEMDRAEGWLKAALAKGPAPAAEIEEQREAAGFSKRTLDRAKARLHIKSFKDGTTWTWALPEQCQDAPTQNAGIVGKDAKDAKDARPGEGGNLPDPEGSS